MPTGLDFTGTPEPDGKAAARHRSSRATAPRSRRARRSSVNYLGQVYDGKKPFDESYAAASRRRSRSASARSSRAGTRRWSAEPVGSRVMLAIPPDEGYGKEGNPDAGIKGTDTLYFVVDILAAG